MLLGAVTMALSLRGARHRDLLALDD